MIPESWGWLLILLVHFRLSASSLNEKSFHFLAGLFVLSSGTLSHICSLAYSRYCFRNIWVNCSLQVSFCSLFAESYANFPMFLTFWCINFSFLMLPKNKKQKQISFLQWFLAFRQGFPISDSSCGVDCALFLVTGNSTVFMFGFHGRNFILCSHLFFSFFSSIIGFILCFVNCKPFPLQIIDLFWRAFSDMPVLNGCRLLCFLYANVLMCCL